MVKKENVIVFFINILLIIICFILFSLSFSLGIDNILFNNGELSDGEIQSFQFKVILFRITFYILVPMIGYLIFRVINRFSHWYKSIMISDFYKVHFTIIAIAVLITTLLALDIVYKDVMFSSSDVFMTLLTLILSYFFNQKLEKKL